MSIYNAIYSWYNEIIDVDEYGYLPDMKFKDFSFICTDGVVKAHKCIIWAVCSIFNTIDDQDNMVVDFDMETTQLAVDLFYGRNPSIIYNINVYLLLNLLNPSSDNLSRIIHGNPDFWWYILKQKDMYEEAGISIQRIIDIMADHEIRRSKKFGEDMDYRIPGEVRRRITTLLRLSR